jgi:hypothetical protein
LRSGAPGDKLRPLAGHVALPEPGLICHEKPSCIDFFAGSRQFALRLPGGTGNACDQFATAAQ